MIKLVSFFMFN